MMRAHVIALTALTAFILCGIFGVATHAAVDLNEGGTDVVSVDLFGLSGASEALDELSAQKRTSP